MAFHALYISTTAVASQHFCSAIRSFNWRSTSLHQIYNDNEFGCSNGARQTSVLISFVESTTNFNSYRPKVTTAGVTNAYIYGVIIITYCLEPLTIPVVGLDLPPLTNRNKATVNIPPRSAAA